MNRSRRLPIVFASIAALLNAHDGRALTYRWTNVPFSSPVREFTAVAVAPSDSAVVYAASPRGFFVSSDAGGTWARRSDLPDVLTLAVDPTNSSLVWAGAGNGGRPTSGLFKSTDGGRNWNLSTITPTVGQFPVYSVAIDPTQPSTLFAGTSVGVYRTKDSGTTWTNLTTGIPLLTNFFAVVIAPSSHTTIYAGTAFQTPRAGVYRSRDGGDSWVQLNSGVAIPDVRALAVDAHDENVVYRSDYSVGVSKTTDGGASWALVRPERGVLTLVDDPVSSGVVYAAINAGSAGSDGTGLLRTTDSGASWARIESGLDGLVVFSLAIDPRNPSTLYAATAPSPFGHPADSGLLRTSDSGASWHPVTMPPLATARVGNVTIDLKIPSSIFLSTVFQAPADFAGAMHSTDGGVTWQPIAPPGGFFVFDPRNGSTVYRGSPLEKSTDSGATWSPLPISALGANVVGLAIDPFDSSILYTASGNGVFSRSTDAGQTWTSSIFVQPIVNSIAADPGVRATLYAGDGIGLFESRDAGASWFRVDGPWGASSPSGPTAVRVVGTDPVGRAVYVEASEPTRGIYRTVDGGTGWERIPAFDGIGLAAIALDAGTGTIYAATASGILRSTDHGASWNAVSDGLPGAASSVAVDPLSSTVWTVSNGLLYKATFQEAASCNADPSTLCLNASRFRVRAAWRTADGATGVAQARADTADTGAFWFFSANNIEVVVKVLDGRPANGHFWVFGAALSDVEYTIEVTDTATGALWTHHNPQGALASFADTTAF